MDLETFTTLYQVLGTTGFLIFIIWQLLRKFVFTDMSGKKRSLDDIEAHILKLETNHLAHLVEDIKRIDTDVSELRKEVGSQGKSIARIAASLGVNE